MTRTIPSTLTSNTRRPLLHGVRLDGALGADAGVVDEDVDAAHRGGGLLDGGGRRPVVGDIGPVTGWLRRARPVGSRSSTATDGAAGEGGGGDGAADPGRAASHQHARTPA